MSVSVIRHSLQFIGFIILVCILVVSTLKGAKDKRNINSALQKIILSHVQMIIIISYFDFNWTPEINTFFQIPRYLGEIVLQLLTVDCLMDKNYWQQSMSKYSEVKNYDL